MQILVQLFPNCLAEKGNMTMLLIFESVHLASQGRSRVPKVARLVEFLKKYIANLLPSEVSYKSLFRNKCRNGKSLEEVERSKRKVSRTGIRSQ